MKKAAQGIVKLHVALVILFIGLLALGLNLMPRVVTNYDLSLYLDQNSDTVIALNTMEDAYGSAGAAQIMISDISLDTALDLKGNIEEMHNIAAVSFDEENGYRDNAALFKLFLESGNYDTETFETMDEIRDNLASYDIALNGEGIRASYLQRAIKKDLKIILAIVAGIIILILLASSSSWVDPLILVIVLGFAVFINLGLNALFPHISFVTRSICIVLQLALSMDYSIILLHSFKEQRALGLSAKEATAEALSRTFAPVLASSLTTIAGLLALAFMQHRIGFDIGVVLAKGVVVSLVSVLLLMPALLIMFADAIQATEHRTVGDWFSAKFADAGKGRFSKFQYKSRRVVPCVLMIIIGSAMLLQSGLQFEYIGDPAKLETAQINVENRAIEDQFGIQNSMVIMVPKGDHAREKELLDFVLDYQLGGEPVFNSGLGLSSTGLPDAYTPAEVADTFGIAENLVEQAFSAMGYENDEEVIMLDLLRYLHDEDFAARLAKDRQDEIDAEYEKAQKLFSANGGGAAQAEADAMQEAIQALLAPLDKRVVATQYSLGDERVEALFASAKPGEEVNVYFLLGYLHNNEIMLEIGAEAQAQIDDAYAQAMEVVDMFESDRLTRQIFNLNLPIASEEAFTVVADLQKAIPAIYTESYLLSESATYSDIQHLFQQDATIINWISFLAIFLIIALTFRSLSIPVILTLLIQGAIWVTMSVNVLTGTPIFFICYLVILCIQMGATVDYAILMTSNYMEARQTLEPEESMYIAFRKSLSTILTSGTILVTAAFIVGRVSNVTIISSLGMILARGCLFSLLFITFALPQILLLCDKAIMRTTWNRRKPS